MLTWAELVSTCITVKHPKAVCVMVPKKLGSNHLVVLLHDFQVSFIKATPEPGHASFLLEEARRDVPHNVDLQKQELH